MFQLMRWSKRPFLKVVRTVDDAFAALGHSPPRTPIDCPSMPIDVLEIYSTSKSAERTLVEFPAESWPFSST